MNWHFVYTYGPDYNHGKTWTTSFKCIPKYDIDNFLKYATPIRSLRGSLNRETWFALVDYVCRCSAAGFAETDQQKVACAERWLVGKRKITPPGHSGRKRIEKQRRKLLKNLPVELLQAVEEVCTENAIASVKKSPKAINALVGAVMKRYKTDAAVIKTLIEENIK